MKSIPKPIINTAFAAYVLLMLWLLFGQRMNAYFAAPITDSYLSELGKRINLIPFRTIAEFVVGLFSNESRHAFINLFGNIVMFVPLGFFIPSVFEKMRAFRSALLLSFAVIVCIEILQLVTLLGSLDTDDLILNMLGAVIGYGLYHTLRKFIPGEK